MSPPSTLQNKNYWNVNKLYAVGSGNPLLCLPPLVTVSRLHLTSLDTPELGPSTIFGSSGPPGLPRRDPLTPIPLPPLQALRLQAAIGGVAGSIATISIIVAALLYYLRRRHPPAPSTSDGQPGGFNPLMDQVLPPVNDPKPLHRLCPIRPPLC
ncbi:hypothetical protein F5888DRAFT_1904276 [Russula emetica]|nr:hypothetical protein F5888DRAFT_1904276 [Russula emetica]